MSIIEHLTSLFAPDDCLGCSREGSLLCRDCFHVLPPLPGRCFRCHEAVEGRASCSDCLVGAGLTTLSVASNYTSTAKLLVASLKFRGNQSAAKLMAEAMLVQAPLPPNAILVGIPATTSHIRQRGFDQSVLIARHISRLTGLQYVNALRRSGQQHQLGADRQQRLEQLARSVSVRSTAVRDRHVILVDDVLTTGSSLMVATNALQAAGAARVSACVFAQSIN